MQKSSKKKTTHCNHNSPNILSKLQIKLAADVLELGGVIAYPTESVFGLGCDPQNEDAIYRLLSIKNRSPAKGLILIAASLDQLKPYIAPLSNELLLKVQQTWPGPTTWLLPANPLAPQVLKGCHPLQAVRVSRHPLVRDLCNQFGGPIVSTSANKSNRPPAKTTIQVQLQFGKDLDYILPGKTSGQKKPCEIKNALNNRIIRPGN